MQKNRLLVALLILMISTTSLQAQDTLFSAPQIHYFSLADALAYAQKNNVQVKNALLDVKLQEQVNREVTGSAYPQISGSGQVTYNYKLATSAVPAEFFGGQAGTIVRIPFGVKWASTNGFSLSQILFDGQVFTGLQARKTLIDFQKKNVEVTEEQIRVNISKIYYQLVVSKTQINFLDSTLALINKNRHDTKIMYDNGFSEKLEIDRLDVQLTNTQSTKTTALNQINNGYLGLKVLLGMPMQDSIVLTDDMTDDNIKEGMLEAMSFDYSQRKDFQYAQLGIRLNEYDIQRYKLSKIPTFSLSAYYDEMAQSNKFDLFSSHSYWSPTSAITLNMHIPIFTGFSTNAKIAQAKIKLQQSQNNLEALKLNIDNQVRTAINNYKSAISDLDYQKRNIALAQKVYDQTKKKYEVGTGTQTEINAARLDLEAAQTNYFNALYNAVIARVDFLKATGKL